ncbi:MAG: hypothetical protein AAGD25_08725 [Cyanobacteria bacterium P01_F01_bin.150]
MVNRVDARLVTFFVIRDRILPPPMAKCDRHKGIQERLRLPEEIA